MKQEYLFGFIFFSILSLIVVFLLTKAKNAKKRPRIILYAIVLLLLTISIGFRKIDGYYGGTDSLGYADQFLYTNDNTYFQSSEFLFKTYIFFLRTFSAHWRILFVVSAFIISFNLLVFIDYFYRRKSFFITILLIWPIFLYYSCVALRNGLAVSFCQLSFVFLSKRKKILSFLISVVAIFFHYSALIYLAYLLFEKFNDIVQRKLHVKMQVVLLISFILVLVSAPILNIVLSGTRYSFLTENVKSSFIGIIPYYLIGIAAFCYYNTLVKSFCNKHVLYSIFFLCIIWPVVQLFGLYRLPYYFIGSLCVGADAIMRMLFTKEKESVSKMYFKIFVAAIFAGFCLLKTITINSDSYFLIYELF